MSCLILVEDTIIGDDVEDTISPSLDRRIGGMSHVIVVDRLVVHVVANVEGGRKEVKWDLKSVGPEVDEFFVKCVQGGGKHALEVGDEDASTIEDELIGSIDGPHEASWTCCGVCVRCREVNHLAQPGEERVTALLQPLDLGKDTLEECQGTFV